MTTHTDTRGQESYDPAAEVVEICRDLIRMDTTNYGDGSGPGGGTVPGVSGTGNVPPAGAPCWWDEFHSRVSEGGLEPPRPIKGTSTSS